MDVFSYLNRPLSFERFLTTIGKIQDYLSSTIYIQHARNLRFVFVKSEYKIIKVKFEDILFCEGMKDYTQITYGLSEPPSGYNSCHGVRALPSRPSQFADDEYVVYDVRQQRLEYLVELTG